MTEHFDIRWISIRLTPSEQKRIDHQIRQVERRTKKHRLNHHLHEVAVQNCPDCK